MPEQCELTYEIRGAYRRRSSPAVHPPHIIESYHQTNNVNLQHLITDKWTGRLLFSREDVRDARSPLSGLSPLISII